MIAIMGFVHKWGGWLIGGIMDISFTDVFLLGLGLDLILNDRLEPYLVIIQGPTKP